MNNDSEKLERYHKIYGQLFDDPVMPVPEIAQNTKMSGEMVSRLLEEMYSYSILKGPMVFLKPAENYPLYVYFLKVKHPVSVFKELKGSHILFKTRGYGDWDIMVISNKEINVEKISGFKQCLYQGKKGVTFFSQVSLLEWEQSITEIHQTETPPDEKTAVLKKIPYIPWGKTEWELFEAFKFNVRLHSGTVKEYDPEKYKEWVSHLPEYAVIQLAFFPEDVSRYTIRDFLFCSQYQKQLVDILGMLPSTSVFFSTGEYVLARIFVKDDYIHDVCGIITQLKELTYFSEVYQCFNIYTGG